MLDKRWKEVLYSVTVCGPNMIMVMLMAYFTDAVMPDLLRVNIDLWSVASKAIVIPVIFGILFTIAKLFDGLVDVPIAYLIDRMKNKYSRVKVPILIGFVPMTLGMIALCLPVTMEKIVFNTVYYFIVLLVFFTFFTLTTLAFYGSLASVCPDRRQRGRIATFKSIIETVGYALAYAVAPLISKGLNINILLVVLLFSPFLLTSLIPLFMLKQKNTFKMMQIAEEEDTDIKRSKLMESVRFVFQNRVFWSWLLVNGFFFFGLQLFLASQNALLSGVLQLDMIFAAVLNSAAFAPVPLMLWIFHKVMKKKGVRFAIQTSMIAFIISIMSFLFGSAYFFPEAIMPRITINAIGATISSYAIGSFFMLPVMIPSQVAAVDLKVTRHNNNAMYFAGQTVIVTVATAISTGVLYNSILKSLRNVVVPSNIAPEIVVDGVVMNAYLIPLGGLLIPIIVSCCCIIALCMSFLMPRKYDIQTIGKSFDPNYVFDEADLKDSETVQSEG